MDSYKFNLLHNKQLFINQLKTNTLGSRTIDEGSMDEDSGMNFSEYVAVLSGNTDLLEKARLDKKITTLESERKNFLRERDAATGKLAEIESSVSFHTDKIKEAQSDLALFEKRVERDDEGIPINKLTIKGVEDCTDIKTIAARLQEIDEEAVHRTVEQVLGSTLCLDHNGETIDFANFVVLSFGASFFVYFL